MSKPQGAPEKKEPHPGKPAGEGAAHKPAAEAPAGKKGHNPLPGGCLAAACKTSVKRFGFCEEHYEQFKFGLLKKTGELVSDHEKKSEHYEAFKAKRRAHKVA